MKYNKINNVLNIGRDIIKTYVSEGDVVVDCTLGNGNDTLLLAQLVGTRGRVYGFDIQETAIYNTKELLRKNSIETNIELFLDSHENIDQYLHEVIDLIVYNLGYLPGGDKSIKTSSSSTIKSIEKSLGLLKKNGILLVTVYPGHPGGIEEKLAIENLFSSLKQQDFHVLKYEFINQINHPPILYFIEKSKTYQ